MPTSFMGIEIGNTNIKIIEAAKRGAVLEVKKFSLLKTPADCVHNGVINNIDVIKKVIQEELKSKKYRAKKVVAVVQSSTIIIRNVVMDKQPEKIIKQLLEVKTEEFLPIEHKQYQIDFKMTGEVEEEGVIKNKLMLVAAPNVVVLPVASLLKRLKLIPISITIPSEALQSIFHSQTRMINETTGNVLILDIGGRSTTVTIITGDEVCLTRMIEFGAEDLSLPTLDEKRDEYFARVVRPQMEYHIVAEIERILQFYYSSYGNGTIKKIYLTGGGSDIKGMRGYIRDALNIPTEKMSYLDSIVEASGIEFENYIRFFVNSLGAINGL